MQKGKYKNKYNRKMPAKKLKQEKRYKHNEKIYSQNGNKNST